MNVAERAKELQTDNDVTVRALSKAIGVNEHNLGNYLNGKRVMPYDVLVAVVKYFHVTTDYLMGLTDDPQLPYLIPSRERTMLGRFWELTGEQRELIYHNIELMYQQNQR